MNFRWFGNLNWATRWHDVVCVLCYDRLFLNFWDLLNLTKLLNEVHWTLPLLYRCAQVILADIRSVQNSPKRSVIVFGTCKLLRTSVVFFPSADRRVRHNVLKYLFREYVSKIWLVQCVEIVIWKAYSPLLDVDLQNST